MENKLHDEMSDLEMIRLLEEKYPTVKWFARTATRNVFEDVETGDFYAVFSSHSCFCFLANTTNQEA